MNKYQESLDELVFCKKQLKCLTCKHKNLCTMERDSNIIQELIDKEKPMKVGKPQPLFCEEDIKNYDNVELKLCPKCKRVVFPFHSSDYSKINYCENCGQKLDWSDDNEI